WPVSSACRPRSRVVFNSAGNSPSEPVISTSPESILANNSSSAPLAWSCATSSLPVVEEVPFSSVIVISCCVSFQHGLHRKLNTPARGGQRFYPQAAVGFDADHHLGGCLGVGRHQVAEPADPGKSLGEPPRGQLGPLGIHQMNVVVVFSPVVSNE